MGYQWENALSVQTKEGIAQLDIIYLHRNVFFRPSSTREKNKKLDYQMHLNANYNHFHYEGALWEVFKEKNLL
jgi:hypothetical protein